jgi:VanZ family protein
MRKLTTQWNKSTTLLLLCTVAWMGVIFAFSAQPGERSAGLSGKIVEALNAALAFIFAGNPPEFLTALQSPGSTFIRKCGHAGEYAVLGGLVVSLVYRLGMVRYFLLSFAFCLIYAASDEFHQIFVPGRGPSVIDVMIDASGSLLGILLLGLTAKRRAKK